MPELSSHFFYHLDAVTGVVLPAFELEGVALEVFVLEFFVELETAESKDNALASLNGLLFVTDHGVAANDFFGCRVLNKALVMAVEDNFNTEVLTNFIQLMEGDHAEAVNGRKLAGTFVGIVV